MAEPLIVVLVHGWSVYSTNTYGELAQRLKTESPEAIDVRHIWISKFVSFKDDVRLEDISRGFEQALRDELQEEIAAGRRIACITHSTGGPVVRDWWDRFYVSEQKSCPLSHLIMLAPANYGSALAQLGKGRLSRLRSAVQQIEPGQRVLDWLELGSGDAWELNSKWIREYPDPADADSPLFLFTLTGQKIDRKFYDHVNSYTGELGSDGTVRVAAANLNATYVRLEQEVPSPALPPHLPDSPVIQYEAKELKAVEVSRSHKTAFALVPGRSHSGTSDGIMFSIKNDGKRHPTVRAILRCLKVGDRDDYDKLTAQFEKENAKVMESERVEIYRRPLLPDPVYIHDAMSMVIIRIRDNHGHVINEFDYKFTGPRNNPDLLPEGFFQDRQRNSHDRGAITYFINYDLMSGSPTIKDRRGRVRRAEVPALKQLGLEVSPRPDAGYVHYLSAQLKATRDNLDVVIKPHETTLIDIVMRRCIRRGVYDLTQNVGPEDFRDPEDHNVGRLLDF